MKNNIPIVEDWLSKLLHINVNVIPSNMMQRKIGTHVFLGPYSYRSKNRIFWDPVRSWDGFCVSRVSHLKWES